MAPWSAELGLAKAKSGPSQLSSDLPSTIRSPGLGRRQPNSHVSKSLFESVLGFFSQFDEFEVDLTPFYHDLGPRECPGMAEKADSGLAPTASHQPLGPLRLLELRPLLPLLLAPQPPLAPELPDAREPRQHLQSLESRSRFVIACSAALTGRVSGISMIS